MSGRLFIIFFSALLLNLVWEHLHSVLYVSYKGDAITSLILFRAALFDAAVITLFSAPFFYSSLLRKRRFILYSLLFIFAILLEKWALGTGRWVYADAMPIIPLLNVGFTPAIQLCLTGWLAHRAQVVIGR